MGAEVTCPGSLAFYGPQTPNTEVTLFFLIPSHGQDLISHLLGKAWWLLPLKWPQASPLKPQANPSIYTLSPHSRKQEWLPLCTGPLPPHPWVLYSEGIATLWAELQNKFLVLFQLYIEHCFIP